MITEELSDEVDTKENSWALTIELEKTLFEVLKIFPVINTGFEHTDESGNTGLNYAVNIVKMWTWELGESWTRRLGMELRSMSSLGQQGCFMKRFIIVTYDEECILLPDELDVNLKVRRILDKEVGNGDKWICILGTREHEFPGTTRMMYEKHYHCNLWWGVYFTPWSGRQSAPLMLKTLAFFWSIQISYWCIIWQVNFDEVDIGHLDEADNKVLDGDIWSADNSVFVDEADVSIDRWFWYGKWLSQVHEKDGDGNIDETDDEGKAKTNKELRKRHWRLMRKHWWDKWWGW